MTQGLMRSCNMKSKLYKKYKLNPTIINENMYKKYKNKLKQLLFKREEKYYAEQIAICSGNLKQIWKILGSLLGSGKGKSFIKS